jgi:hypothetical protein
MKRIFLKKCFLFTVGRVYRVKRFTTGPLKNHLGGKRFTHDVEVEMEVRKRLRQRSKDFYAECFDALVKRINVGGRYVEI